MNKTRMGKRAASLLLSLVMMLSLLPTAAYAAMADGVETQGAIVSENGTDVSDDSSSSDTGDLQVGDSKDSDGTGDQQVEGSNGSGTADDTTGTEGGADPTDSVNGNDSADPQDDGDAVLPTATTVAKVGGIEYDTLDDAIVALSSSSYTLELLDDTAWDAATPVYWAADAQSGYAATLADALTAAYKTNAGAITIVCRPGADVGTLTHGHVADDITIYGNNAYISSGECDLEVDTYTFSRDTGKQVEAGGAYLEKDITVTAYELDNLGVWGQRHTDHKVTVNLTDCDSTDGITVQRVYISGTTGVNDITLTGCDFGTKATSVYSNADGAVVIDNCSFTGAQVPVNFNHKANGTQTVAVQNSTFTNCGDNGDWEQFAAPVRFVNSGSGTMTTTVATCTFTDTVGSNGDILLGDGRVDQNSNDVALTVESTKATVQAQQPGYYGKDGTTDASKQGTKTVAAGDKLTTSVTQLMPSDTTTYVAEVGTTKYETLQAAIDAAAKNATVTLLADAAEDVVISKSITLDLGGKTLTNTNGGKATISVTGGTVTVKNGNVVGGTSYYNIEAKKDANLTLTDVTATAGNTGSSMIDNWGTLTITSGTYTGGLNVVKSEEGSVLNISGGTFTLSYATSGYTGVIFAYGDTTISGGEFIQSLTTTGRWNHPTVILTGVVEGYAAITRVTGGHFVNKMSGESIFRGVGKGTSDNFEVSGGTFNKSIPDGYCADGFIPTKNTDGTYGVKEGQYVAKVGSTKYETLADAIRLAAKGKTVKLLADVADCGSLTISKNITLDGGGHTISGNSSISVNMPGNAAADVTIKNVNFKDIANGNKLSAFYFSQVKGKLTITGCTFDSIEYEAIQVTPMEGAEVNVSSNVFKAKADGTQVRHIHIEMAYGSGFDCEGQNIKLTVTDNQLHGTVSGDASMGIWWVGTDSTLKVDGNYMEHPETVSITLSNGGVHYNRGDLIYPARSQADADVDDLIPAVIVADKASGESKIKAYSTLADAVAAAQDGQTVRLLADVALDAQIATGKAITIDGQSKYTIKTVKKLASADGKAGMFYRTQSAKGTLTFLNVTLDGGGVSKIFLNEGGAGETVFDGVTSTNGGGIAYGSGIHISGGGSHATIRNSTLTGSTGTMELNNANYYAANDLWVGGNVYVTVENSVIGNVFVNSAPSATATNGVVHGQLTITGEKTKITYLSGEEEAADKLDKFGNNGSLVKIDSGYVEKVFDKGSYAISGGTFKTEVKKEWCAAGYVPTQNADGTYGVEIGKFTVMVTSRTTGSDSPVANVAGGGSDITYAVGIKVTASAISGYKFVGWFVNEYTGTPYSTDLTCKVKPTDDWTMIAVYEPISGGVFALEVSASKFTVNGGATQRSYLLEKMPVGTQVTVVFKGSENFLYWVNESGKVVSTSKTYTFSMGSATTLKAVYAEKEEHQAMVVFISHTQQVISSKGYTDTQEIQFPEPPIKMGATFVRWSMTEAEIRAAMATTTTGIIVVEPVYEFSAGSYTVTVNYPNDETATYTATVGKITTVTAKSIDGKVFKCWKNGDTVLGYTETLKIAPRGDLTLTAEYVDAGTTVDRLPVIALTEISASQQGAKYAVSFTATRSVPDGYTVTEQGILVSTNSRYGQSDALDAMKLDANGAKPDDTFILKATNTDATGVTVLNGTVSAADRTVYGRAYMILRDSSGAMVYVYSDTILSGSYNSLTTNGGN